jgi:hypothetical protein
MPENDYHIIPMRVPFEKRSNLDDGKQASASSPQHYFRQ